MKEATGELNMTVVTIIAIAGIAAFLTVFLWPNIKNSISNQWNNIENSNMEQP
ncbi:MAG: hypothetical protein IK997_04540 [Bacilli bacterium]|nr:hypothetical protein [Bacilli bacterium]